LRLQHWVFSTQDIFMICAGYIYVQFAASLIVYVSVLFYVEYMCVECSCSFLVLYIRCLFYSIGIYDSPLLCEGKNACLSGDRAIIVFRCPQLLSIYCGTVCGMLFSDCPCIFFLRR
jgi:hypothetical protein